MIRSRRPETLGPRGGRRPAARRNLLQLHPDHPDRWDAWDLDALLPTHRHRPDRGRRRSPCEGGDGRRCTRAVRRLHAWRSGSGCAGDRVEIDTEVDWHERENVLKAGRSTCDVHADQAAVRDPVRARRPADPRQHHLGRGAVRGVRAPLGARRRARVRRRAGQRRDVRPRRRPGTHAPAAATYSTIRATLLRAPRFPDPDTDQGRHVFRHALVPGADVAAAAAAGYALNLPLRRRHRVRRRAARPRRRRRRTSRR